MAEAFFAGALFYRMLPAAHLVEDIWTIRPGAASRSGIGIILEQFQCQPVQVIVNGRVLLAQTWNEISDRLFDDFVMCQSKATAVFASCYCDDLLFESVDAFTTDSNHRDYRATKFF